jgi:hypothetical protein
MRALTKFLLNNRHNFLIKVFLILYALLALFVTFITPFWYCFDDMIASWTGNPAYGTIPLPVWIVTVLLWLSTSNS